MGKAVESLNQIPEISIRLQRLSGNNLETIADVHVLAFPESSLTKLGREAVKRFYGWLLSGTHDVVAWGAFNNSELVGCCFGGIFRGAMSGFLRKNRGFLVLQVISRPWLLRNDIFLGRVKHALKLLRKGKTRHAQLQTCKAQIETFGIQCIAVLPQYQRLGIGKKIMEMMEEEARLRGFQEMRLSVHPQNSRAVNFYEKLGWQKDVLYDKWDGSMQKMLLQDYPLDSLKENYG